MKTFNYHKKYHYILKYVVMALPIIILIIGCASKNNYNDIITLLTTYFNNFKSLNINQFWQNILALFNFNLLNDNLSNIILNYPLYILWVYLIDLTLDIISIIPRFSHKLLNKFGGDYNE